MTYRHFPGSSLLFVFLMLRLPPISTRTDTLFPYTTLFRSVVDLLGIAACKQVGVDAGDAAQFGQVELQEFFRTRTRALPVQPPLAAVGQDAPLHRLVGHHGGAAEVAQHLAGRGAGVERIAAVAAVERTTPALGFDPDMAVAITAAVSSDERHVGTGGVGKCRYRGSPEH